MAVAIAAHESGCVLTSIAEGVVLDTTVIAGAQLILETCMLFQGLAPSSEGGAWLSSLPPSLFLSARIPPPPLTVITTCTTAHALSTHLTAHGSEGFGAHTQG